MEVDMVGSLGFIVGITVNLDMFKFQERISLMNIS